MAQKNFEKSLVAGEREKKKCKACHGHGEGHGQQMAELGSRLSPGLARGNMARQLEWVRMHLGSSKMGAIDMDIPRSIYSHIYVCMCGYNTYLCVPSDVLARPTDADIFVFKLHVNRVSGLHCMQ